MSDKIEPSDVLLAHAKADLKRAAMTIEELRSIIEMLEERVQEKDSMLDRDLCTELAEKDKRIEELEDASVKEVLDFGVEQLNRGHYKYHLIIATEQIEQIRREAGESPSDHEAGGMYRALEIIEGKS